MIARIGTAWLELNALNAGYQLARHWGQGEAVSLLMGALMLAGAHITAEIIAAASAVLKPSS